MKTKSINLVIMTLFLVLFTNALSAQDSDSKISVSKVVSVSADKMWKVLRQMDNVDKFSPQIDKVVWTGEHGVGGERVCYGNENRFYVKEKIVKFDDVKRTYSYAVVEGAPAKDMVNTFKVVDLGDNKSKVVWSTSYTSFIQNPRFTEEQFRGATEYGFNDFIGQVAMTANK
ncbi:SRPBCC family protein [Flavivirga algicola]|uniref:SRPBCC family protein n=1 Tax=Flavivirga algicola TaxID=2729136 RepID=A0ABX1RZP6_9FLAO|nr:SRPBCC family protein [Flavivirga algicola]NMH89066.1 SRPBCC family protein [Flavivirga algicola]